MSAQESQLCLATLPAHVKYTLFFTAEEDALG